MDPANQSSTSPPFRLLDLPLELQRIIFGYTLFTKSTLRRPSEVSHHRDVVIFSGTNILRVSNQINEETLPIFYQVNNFHYEHFLEYDHHGSIVGVQHLPSIFMRSLHMMRHISIDPIQRKPSSRREYWSSLPALGDRNLDEILVLIERAAPNIRTLALHFPTFYTKSAHERFLLQSINTGGRDSCVILTLCRLRARLDRLSLVCYDQTTAFDIFLSNIASLEDWTAQTLEFWPVIISPTGTRYFSRRRIPHHQRFRTRVWDLCHHPGLHAGGQES